MKLFGIGIVKSLRGIIGHENGGISNPAWPQFSLVASIINKCYFIYDVDFKIIICKQKRRKSIRSS